MDVKQLTFRLEYQVNGVKYLSSGADTEHLSLKTSVNNGKLTVTLCPKQSLSINSFTVKSPYSFKEDSRIFVNGYQSWTDSLEYRPHEQMSELSELAEFGVMFSLHYGCAAKKACRVYCVSCVLERSIV